MPAVATVIFDSVSPVDQVKRQSGHPFSTERITVAPLQSVVTPAAETVGGTGVLPVVMLRVLEAGLSPQTLLKLAV